MSEQLLPGATPTSEGKRKRNKSVSNMEKASIEPPEEEEEEQAVVNGNGVAITPGQSAGATPAGVTVQVGRAGQTQLLPSSRGRGLRVRSRTQEPFQHPIIT